MPVTKVFIKGLNKILEFPEGTADIEKQIQKNWPTLEEFSGLPMDKDSVISRANYIGFDAYNLGRVGDSPALPGAPSSANIPNVGRVEVGPDSSIVESAKAYSEKSGIPLTEVKEYMKVDENFAKNVAREFDLMKHQPMDIETKESYTALANETLEQFKQMIDDGVKPYFIKDDSTYANSPYESLIDLTQNKRLGVFPTRGADGGFGTGSAFDPTGNPLLEETGLFLDGEPVLYNDAFRAVHDYYGHGKTGVGFRANGEENAYRAHSGMYSDIARKAAATETRGQNSWLNFGPYGEKNKTAAVEDTIFADQKTGLLPNWAVTQRTPLADERRQRFFEALRNNESGSNAGLEGAISSDGRVTLKHYSREPIERIDPTQYGKGLSKKTVSERNRSFDDDFQNRAFYGIEGTNNPYKKEMGLGENESVVDFPIEQIYDIANDPDNLKSLVDKTKFASPQEQITQIEKLIKQKGYSGFFNRTKSGDIASIFDPLDAGKKYAVPFAAGALGMSTISPEEAEAGPLTAGARRIIDERFTSALGGSPRKGLQDPIETMQTGINQRPMDKGSNVNLYDFEGSPYILTQSDRSAAGGELTSLRGKDIDPVDLRGGRDFMFDKPSEGFVWASDPNVVKSLHNRADRLSDAYGKDTLLLPYSMAPTGIDFATMPLDAMVNHARSSMSKANKKKLDKMIAEVIPEWGGVDNPFSNGIFRDVKGPSRKRVADIIDKNFRDVPGGLSISEARAATTDAAQYMTPDGNIKNIGRIDTSRAYGVDAGHPTYQGGLPGEGIGTLEDELSVRPFLADAGRELTYDNHDIRALSMNHGLSQGVISEKLLRDIYGKADPSLLAGIAAGSAGLMSLAGNAPKGNLLGDAIRQNMLSGVPSYVTATSPFIDHESMPNQYKAGVGGYDAPGEYVPSLLHDAGFMLNKLELPLIGNPLGGIAEYLMNFGYDDTEEERLKRAAWAAADVL